MSSRKNPDASGFSGLPPEGEIPPLKPGDLDEIMRGGVSSEAEKNNEKRTEGKDVLELLALKHGSYLVDVKSKKIFRVGDEFLHPVLDGGGQYITRDIAEGIDHNFSFQEIQEKLESGEFVIPDEHLTLDDLKTLLASSNVVASSTRPEVAPKAKEENLPVVGDVLVSKSGTRRIINEVIPDPSYRGGGQIKFIRVDDSGHKSNGEMTYEEYVIAIRQGVIKLREEG